MPEFVLGFLIRFSLLFYKEVPLMRRALSLFVFLAVLCTVPATVNAVPVDRGDANGDGTVGVSDAIYISNFLFGGGPPPPCMEAADADANGTVNNTDIVAILNHLFLGCGVCIGSPTVVDC